MRRAVIIALALALLSNATFAADDKSMSPGDLESAAVSAVDNNDADGLLRVMQEMKRRNMLFFRQADPADADICKREPPKIGVGGTAMRWGLSGQAYGAYLKLTQMNNHTCGCLSGQMTYRDFLKEKFKTTPEDMTMGQFVQMRDWYWSKAVALETDYFKYYRASCQGK